MTPRRRALAIPLTLCTGECSADPVLCVIHQQIAQAIADAERDVLAATTETR